MVNHLPSENWCEVGEKVKKNAEKRVNLEKVNPRREKMEEKVKARKRNKTREKLEGNKPQVVKLQEKAPKSNFNRFKKEETKKVLRINFVWGIGKRISREKEHLEREGEQF